MALFSWWAGLSPWFRYGVAGRFLLASTVAWLAGRFWPYGWVAGLVMLASASPSESEKKGYHF